jgi:hypothetical protein
MSRCELNFGAPCPAEKQLNVKCDLWAQHRNANGDCHSICWSSESIPASQNRAKANRTVLEGWELRVVSQSLAWETALPKNVRIRENLVPIGMREETQHTT